MQTYQTANETSFTKLAFILEKYLMFTNNI